jgi:hypothetical protein
MHVLTLAARRFAARAYLVLLAVTAWLLLTVVGVMVGAIMIAVTCWFADNPIWILGAVMFVAVAGSAVEAWLTR